MTLKNHYKKIFVGVAALFVLFAPISLVPRFNFALAQTTNVTATPKPAGTTVTPTPTTGQSTQKTPTPTTPNLFACTAAGGSLATCGVYLIAIVINGIITVGIAIAAFFTRIGLSANSQIFSSPEVQTGFSVALAIANFGFVLGIIIIALATIIRNQTYGIKQLLWKLIMMAILVNFGLVITGPIVGISDI